MAVGPKVEYKLVATRKMQSHQCLTSQSVLTASPTVSVCLGTCSKSEWFIHLTVVSRYCCLNLKAWKANAASFQYFSSKLQQNSHVKVFFLRMSGSVYFVLSLLYSGHIQTKWNSSSTWLWQKSHSFFLSSSEYLNLLLLIGRTPSRILIAL